LDACHPPCRRDRNKDKSTKPPNPVQKMVKDKLIIFNYFLKNVSPKIWSAFVIRKFSRSNEKRPHHLLLRRRGLNPKPGTVESGRLGDCGGSLPESPWKGWRKAANLSLPVAAQLECCFSADDPGSRLTTRMVLERFHSRW
jgi:hypothetical protein